MKNKNINNIIFLPVDTLFVRQFYLQGKVNGPINFHCNKNVHCIRVKKIIIIVINQSGPTNKSKLESYVHIYQLK